MTTDDDDDVPHKRQYALEDIAADGTPIVRCAGCGGLLKLLPDDHSHEDDRSTRRER